MLHDGNLCKNLLVGHIVIYCFICSDIQFSYESINFSLGRTDVEIAHVVSLMAGINGFNQCGNLCIDVSHICIVVSQFVYGQSICDGFETCTKGVHVTHTCFICCFLFSFGISPFDNDIANQTFYNI